MAIVTVGGALRRRATASALPTLPLRPAETRPAPATSTWRFPLRGADLTLLEAVGLVAGLLPAITRAWTPTRP
jgi:hypothetical protein